LIARTNHIGRDANAAKNRGGGPLDRPNFFGASLVSDGKAHDRMGVREAKLSNDARDRYGPRNIVVHSRGMMRSNCYRHERNHSGQRDRLLLHPSSSIIRKVQRPANDR
jgi:hypothetical protein